MTSAQNVTAARPPVIVVTGHIDHGKSTLLDHIRKSNVVDREAGGITQHVSAYEVEHESGDKGGRITFLDTPGHAAFSSIRERGARIADIAILIVSAEDGVKPQTVEALNAVKEAGIPYVVAINKIDKPAANVERTKANLAEHGVFIEGYGGDIPAVQISAKTGQGVDELLDMLNLVADMQELKGDPGKPAEGYVLESNLDPKKGITATLIVKDGSLARGQFVSAGGAVAPVRIMENFLGKPISAASFSSPVRIIGWDALPRVGAEFRTFSSRNDALAHAQADKEKTVSITRTTDSSEPEEGVAVIPVVVKADTMGSLEAILKETAKLSTEKARVRIVHSGIGTITENDLRFAEAGKNTIVIGFNTKPDATAKSYALRNEIELNEFNIIYKLTEWFEGVVKERTPKMTVEETTGVAKVLKLFGKTKDRQVLGARVESGTLKLNQSVKILRREAEIGHGKVKELQHNKSKVSEVADGTEFGALVEFSIEIAPGDRLAAFEIVER